MTQQNPFTMTTVSMQSFAIATDFTTAHHNIPPQSPVQQQRWQLPVAGQQPIGLYGSPANNAEGPSLPSIQQQSSSTNSPLKADNHMLMQHRLLYMKKMSGAVASSNSPDFSETVVSSSSYAGSSESASMAMPKTFSSPTSADLSYSFIPQLQPVSAPMRPQLAMWPRSQINDTALQRLHAPYPYAVVSPAQQPVGTAYSINGSTITVPAGNRVVIRQSVGDSGVFFPRFNSEVVAAPVQFNRLPQHSPAVAWIPQSSTFHKQHSSPELRPSIGVELANRYMLSSSASEFPPVFANDAVAASSRNNVVAVATLTTGDRRQVSLVSLDDLTSPGNVGLQRLNVFSPVSSSDDYSNDSLVPPPVVAAAEGRHSTPSQVEFESTNTKQQQEENPNVALLVKTEQSQSPDVSYNSPQKTCEPPIEQQRLPFSTWRSSDRTSPNENPCNVLNTGDSSTFRDGGRTSSSEPIQQSHSGSENTTTQVQASGAQPPIKPTAISSKDGCWLPSFGVFVSPNAVKSNAGEGSNKATDQPRRPFSPSVEDSSSSSSNSYGMDYWPSSSSSSLTPSVSTFNMAADSLPTSSQATATSPFSLRPHSIVTSATEDNSSSGAPDMIPARDVYCCHICTFVELFTAPPEDRVKLFSKAEEHWKTDRTTSEMFKEHMGTHFEHRCPNCDYTSRTEGRLKKHIKDFHTADSANAHREPGRPKLLRCRQCDFVSQTKTEFWQHARTHIKMDKVLQCPRCPFVTEYKHHLEYHLRNHFGSKPFQCPKCNYACVNKSMLNSHMKSHTNVYQYRCAECSYATKYCHSLKLHLQKYCHRPAVVLNPDGSLPIDGSGSFEVAAKRGPPKGTPKSKRHAPGLPSLAGLHGGSGQANSSTLSPPAVASDVPAMIATTPTTPYPAALLMKNDWAAAAVGDPTARMPPLLPLHPTAEHLALSWQQQQQQQQQAEATAAAAAVAGATQQAPWLPTCSFCHYKFTDHRQLLQHIVHQHAAENRDILAMIGVSADSLLDTADTSPRPVPHLQTFDSSPVRGFRDSWPKTAPASFTASAGTAYWHARQARPNNTGSDGGIVPERDEDDMPRPKSMPAMLVKEKAGSEVTMTTTKQAGERPLDLTKRIEESTTFNNSEFNNAGCSSRKHSSSSAAAPDQDGGSYKQHVAMESEIATNVIGLQNSSRSSCNSPTHKRSRKGKAYKLDTLRLQLGSSNTQSPASSDASSSSDGALGSTIPSSRRPSLSPTIRGHTSTVSIIPSQDAYALALTTNSADQQGNGGNIPLNTFADYIQYHRIHHQARMQQQQSPPVFADIPNEVVRCIDSESNNNTAQYANNRASSASNRGPVTLASDSLRIISRRESLTSAVQDTPNSGSNLSFECQHCQIVFRDYVMYMMHKGYHGYQHPFTCNMCGFYADDRLEFFIHIARVAHE